MPATRTHRTARRSAVLLTSLAIALASATLTAPAASAATKPGDLVSERQWGGTGSNAGKFDYPIGIAADSSGYLYVADVLNFRVQKFSATGAHVRSWGSHGTTEGKFGEISQVAVDADGYVYVTDNSNHRVQKFTGTGRFVRAWGSEGGGPGQFQNPNGITVDAQGRVYVADTFNHRVQRFSASGTFQAQWGVYGTAQGQFVVPRGIATDAAGNVYVSETGDATLSTVDRIQKFTADGAYVSTVATYGTALGQVKDPFSITTGSSGDLYVADSGNFRIQKFSSAGNALGTWGSNGSGTGQFQFLRGITVASGRVYVSDSTLNRATAFRPAKAPTFTKAPAATAKQGRAYASTVKASGFPAVSRYVIETGSLPKGVTLSRSGKISGTPTRAGSYRFTVKAYNGVTPSAYQSYRITVS